MKRATLILPGAAVLLLGLCLTGFSCGRAPDAEIDAKLRELDAGFATADSQEDFEALARLCQDVLDRGFVNGDLLFCQGNAFMEAHMPGRAIAAYQNARRFRIRDARLKSNLETALGGRLSEDSRSLIDHFFFWQAWLSYPEKYQAAVLAGVITLLLGLLLFRYKRAAALRRSALLFLFLTLILCASTALDWYCYDFTRHGVIVTDDVFAWKGNSISSSKAFKEPLGEGTGFVVLEEWGKWVRIRLDSDQVKGTGKSGESRRTATECWILRDAAVFY